MNLAIEYFVRSGAAKDAFETPCSLMLTHLQDRRKRLVLTFKWHDFSKSYLVQQWKVSSCPVDALFPDFDETEVSDINELFTHESAILSGYQLLPFTESPYKAGIRQRGTGQRASKQELEYQSTLSEFLNPQIHQRLRLCWLWATFLQTHAINTNEEALYTKIDENMAAIRDQYRTVWQKWSKWTDYFLPQTRIAPELVFQEPYEAKVKEEILKLPPRPTWQPWQTLGIATDRSKMYGGWHWAPTVTFMRKFTKGNVAGSRSPKKLVSHHSTIVPPGGIRHSYGSSSSYTGSFAQGSCTSDVGRWGSFAGDSTTINYETTPIGDYETNAVTSGGYGSPITVWFSP
jgi:hypothetical protein